MTRFLCIPILILPPPLQYYPAPSERTAGTEQKSEIVPATIIVNLIRAYIARKERKDESDWHDYPVPQADPETCDIPVRRSNMLEGVGTGGTTRQKQDTKEQQMKVRFLHNLLSLKKSWIVANFSPRIC